MLAFSYTFDVAVQELAAVRARHREAVSRNSSPISRNVHDRSTGHGMAAIAIVDPEL